MGVLKVSEVSEKNEKVSLRGWVHELRDLSKMKFILLRDVSGIIQCIIKDKKIFEKFDNLSLESVVQIEGNVKNASVKSEFTRKDVELEVTNLEVLNHAEDLPIQVNEKTTKTGLATRLDYRFIDVRKRKVLAVFKIQSEIANSFREYFYKKGYLEMQPPCIISAASEGGTDLFEVKYFEEKAYLAQSPQLYKQMMACSWEKVFSFTPIWRAEKHNTTRHINEIRQMDIECAFMDQMQIMKEQEGCLKFIVENVIKKCKNDLGILGISLEVPNGVYLSYEEAIKKVKGEMGEDFTPEQERELCNFYPGDAVFVYSWPSSIKPFYIMPKDGKSESKISEGFDCLYGGIEISSGGQRIHLPELLIEMLKEKELNPEDFKDYVDSFRFGAPHHSGWSIGLERLTQVICGLNNIKEATLFPRDRDRLTP